MTGFSGSSRCHFGQRMKKKEQEEKEEDDDSLNVGFTAA